MAGLDLDLADPVAHPGGDRVAGRVGLPRQRLGQEADRRQRRPQLVRQVVDELGSDLLEATQLGDVLEDDPEHSARGAPGMKHEPWPVRRGDGHLAGRRTTLKRGAGDRLYLRVEEGLDERAADERPRCHTKERVRRAVRRVDPPPIDDLQDALMERRDERLAVLGVAPAGDVKTLGARGEGGHAGDGISTR